VVALLPLKPQDYQILFVLMEGERHGYGMVKEIERQTTSGDATTAFLDSVGRLLPPRPTGCGPWLLLPMRGSQRPMAT
jgi:hypothetical protein